MIAEMLVVFRARLRGICFQFGESLSDDTTHGAGLLALGFAFMAIRAIRINAFLCQTNEAGLTLAPAAFGFGLGTAGRGGLVANSDVLLGATIHQGHSKIRRTG